MKPLRDGNDAMISSTFAYNDFFMLPRESATGSRFPCTAFRADDRLRAREIDAPIEADHFAIDVREIREQAGRVGAEMDARNVFRRFAKCGKYFLDMRQNDTRDNRRAQTTDPAVEKLHRLHASIDLRAKDTRRSHPTKFSIKRAHASGCSSMNRFVSIHVRVGLPFYQIARERERRAGKTDERDTASCATRKFLSSPASTRSFLIVGVDCGELLRRRACQ